MKKITVALLFLVFAFFASAQSWKWGVYGNRTAGTEGYGVAIDKSANVFLTGVYVDSLVFGPYVLKYKGDNSFLVKYDSSGNLKWAVTPRTNYYSTAYSVATDNSGNVFMTGVFQDSLIFGADKLYSSIGAPFIVKYNATGTELWAGQGTSTGSGSSRGTSTTTDLKGNVFVTGYFSDTIAFGPYQLYSDGQPNLFIVKYDSSGNVIWARQSDELNSYAAVNGDAVTTDLQGNVYVASSFRGKAGFGSFILNDSLGEDVYVAKYDTGGNVVWAEQSSVPSLKSSGLGVSVIADASDNVYVTGQITDTLSFGPFTLATSALTKREIFLAKYNVNGNPLWAEASASNASFIPPWKAFSLAIDSARDVYLAGGTSNMYSDVVASISFGSDTFQIGNTPSDPAILVKFDSNGNVLCGSITNSGGEDGDALAAGPSGKYVYLGGDIAAISIFGSDTINGSSAELPFIAKWNPCLKEEETGSNEIRNAQNTISIFPNPCSNNLTIDFENQPNLSSIQIMDIAGRVLSTYNLRLTTYDYSLDVSYLAPGMYFLRSSSGTGTEVKKFIKE